MEELEKYSVLLDELDAQRKKQTVLTRKKVTNRDTDYKDYPYPLNLYRAICKEKGLDIPESISPDQSLGLKILLDTPNNIPGNINYSWRFILGLYKEKYTYSELMKIYHYSLDKVKREISYEIQQLSKKREFQMAIIGIKEYKKQTKIADFTDSVISGGKDYLKSAIKKCTDNGIIYISDLESDEGYELLKSMRSYHVKALADIFWYADNYFIKENRTIKKGPYREEAEEFFASLAPDKRAALIESLRLE